MRRENRVIDVIGSSVRASPRRAALRIAVAYALVATTWILVSDRLVAGTPDWVQSAKGGAFVAVTATALYALVAADRRRRSLAARMLDVAELEERRRISEDIHDDPLQLMTSASMRLELVARRIEGEPHHDVVVEALETCRLATARLRAVMTELHPRGLEQGGLDGALRNVLDHVRSDTLVTTLESTIEEPPGPHVASVLFRSAREAINNAARHARADRIDVVIERRGRGTLVRVTDDGVGTPTTDSGPEHLGLVTMVERVERVGGSARIDGRRGAGTTVELWAPDEVAAGPRGPRAPD